MWGYHPVAGLTFLGCKLEALRECNAFDDHTSIELASRTNFSILTTSSEKLESDKKRIQMNTPPTHNTHTRILASSILVGTVRINCGFTMAICIRDVQNIFLPYTVPTCGLSITGSRPTNLRSSRRALWLVWKANRHRTRKDSTEQGNVGKRYSNDEKQRILVDCI